MKRFNRYEYQFGGVIMNTVDEEKEIKKQLESHGGEEAAALRRVKKLE
jgi:hypothetical protein